MLTKANLIRTLPDINKGNAMKVNWEDTDVRSGRKVWRDAPCMVVGNPNDHSDSHGVIVLGSGRIMVIGTKAEVAAYMTANQYRPTEEK